MKVPQKEDLLVNEVFCFLNSVFICLPSFIVCDDTIVHTGELGTKQQNCICNGFDSDSL